MQKPTIDQAIAILQKWCHADPPTNKHHINIDFMPNIEKHLRSESENGWRCVAYQHHGYVYAYGSSMYDALCKCCDNVVST